jgi:hypothetical protein
MLLTSVAMAFLSISALHPAGPISATCSSLDRDVFNVVKDVLVVESSPVHWIRYRRFVHLKSV